MMEQTRRLSVAGVTLASLFYELTASSTDMEGLLFGTTTHQVVQSFNDVQSQGAEEGKTTVAIQGFVCCGGPFSFYDGLGRVNKEKLEAFIGNRSKQSLIGWFKFRRHSPLRASVRETEVHSQLTAIWAEYNRDRPQNLHFGFLLGLFTSSYATEIHTYDYRFLHTQTQRGGMKAVGLEVVNLMQSAHIEYNAFKTVSAPAPALAEVAREPVDQVLGALSTFFGSSLNQLQTLAGNVHASTLEIRLLHRQIDELRRKEAALHQPPVQVQQGGE